MAICDIKKTFLVVFFTRYLIDSFVIPADVMELVDVVDSKSTSSNRVLVRVQSSASQPNSSYELFGFLFSRGYNDRLSS